MPVTITTIAGGAPRPVFDRLAPAFTARTGHRINPLYDTMSGIAARVRAGEALDVLVMPVDLLDAYEKEGVVRHEGRATLGLIGLGVGVQAGRARPDISTPEALRAALTAARCVVHATPSATPSGAHSDKVIRELGLAETLAGRVVHRPGLAGGVAMIASGEAEIGIFPKSELANIDGVAVAGPLPAPLQLTIVYGAAITGASPAPAEAGDYIRFLTAPENRVVWTAAGFDPPAA